MLEDEAYISQYGVIIPSADGHGVMGVFEEPRQDEAPSNLASIGRYILTSDIFDSLRNLPTGSGRKIQLAHVLNLHAQDGLL
jgi:UTP--glucose-1-phosphate uridylyltransferase